MLRLLALTLALSTLVSCKTTRTVTGKIEKSKKGLEGRLLDVDKDKQFELGSNREFGGMANSMRQKKFMGGGDEYNKKEFNGANPYAKPAYSAEAFSTSKFYHAQNQADLPDDITHTDARESTETYRQSGDDFRDGTKILPTDANYEAAKGQETAERPVVQRRPNSTTLSEEEVRELLNKKLALRRRANSELESPAP